MARADLIDVQGAGAKRVFAPIPARSVEEHDVAAVLAVRGQMMIEGDAERAGRKNADAVAANPEHGSLKPRIEARCEARVGERARLSSAPVLALESSRDGAGSGEILREH